MSEPFTTPGWPSFQPHPDHEDYCYVCGKVKGAHGLDTDHCPPATLPAGVKSTAAQEDSSDLIAQMRAKAAEVRGVASDLGNAVLLERGAELLDLADTMEDRIRVFLADPRVGDRAWAHVTERAKHVLDSGDITEEGSTFLLVYAMADKVRGLGTSNMIGGALTAFAGSMLAGSLGRNAGKLFEDDGEDEDDDAQEQP